MITVSVDSSALDAEVQRLQTLGAHPEPILRAAITTLKNITVGTYSTWGAHLRPLPWPAKKDGTPSHLQKSGTLATSWYVEVSDTEALLGNPTPYAAIHQFGGAIPIPARWQTLAFARPGRFLSRKAAARRKRGAISVRVVQIGSHVVNMPARPQVPIDASGALTPAAAGLVRDAAIRAARAALGG